MKRLQVTVVLAGAIALAGCFTRTMSLPANFVKVDQPPAEAYAFRAVSADGVMLALRTEKNPEHGTLEFWTEAVTNQMTTGRGYKAEASEAIKSAGGVPGRLLVFSARKQGAAFTYILALYVQGGEVLIAEAGGRTEAVEPKMADIRKSLLSAR